MPMVEVDGEGIGQAVAINLFIASECGLLGNTHFEAAKIMSFHEHAQEMYKAYLTLVPERTTPLEQNVEMWFSGGATDISGPAD
jgi:hypothetical protein